MNDDDAINRCVDVELDGIRAARECHLERGGRILERFSRRAAVTNPLHGQLSLWGFAFGSVFGTVSYRRSLAREWSRRDPELGPGIDLNGPGAGASTRSAE